MIAPIVWLLTLILHAASAHRYGYFRDELYFIACGRHLAWGYVDQPPLVAVAARLSAPFGNDLLALRALPILAAAGAAGLAVHIAAELGAGRFGRWCAGIAVALMPAYLLLGNTLTTTSFEALSWMLAIWCTMRIVRDGWPAWWLALAASVAFGLYGKYSMALLVLALVAGLLATRERRILATGWVGIATVVTLALVGPNLWWQAIHGFPMIAVLFGDAAHRHALNAGIALEYKNSWHNAVAFTVEQVLYTSPAIATLWVAGAVAPFTMERLRDLRFISIAYVVLFIVAALLGAKGYYIVGVYGTLIAIGSVAIEAAASWVRIAVFAAVCAIGLATMPLSLPVLSLPAFLRYSQLLGLTGTPPHLVQPVYAEEFGWNRLARDVAGVYHGLPPAQRARTAIYADTYADAGAIDLFGGRYGLPRAISSQNSYYLWGTHGYDGRSLIAIGATRIERLRRYYRSVRLVRTSDEPLKWIVEGPDPIYLCTDPVMPLARMWPHLRWYGA
ncbi:MAG: glycosyltransferase family 39 protein [Vulcanimicrobiaceae bacterium]